MLYWRQASISSRRLCPRVVRGSIFIDPVQPNPPNNWPNPTQPTARWTYGPMTQLNPYLTEPPYIEQQLACRKKISLCTSCHHHHPNAHRNNANTHSITSITVILGLFQTDEAEMHQLQVFTKRICQSILDTNYICTTCIFSHICHFRPMTQTNPLKTNFRPIPDPTQPNPTRGSTQPMDNSAVEICEQILKNNCLHFGLLYIDVRVRTELVW